MCLCVFVCLCVCVCVCVCACVCVFTRLRGCVYLFYEHYNLYGSSTLNIEIVARRKCSGSCTRS